MSCRVVGVGLSSCVNAHSTKEKRMAKIAEAAAAATAEVDEEEGLKDNEEVRKP